MNRNWASSPDWPLCASPTMVTEDDVRAQMVECQDLVDDLRKLPDIKPLHDKAKERRMFLWMDSYEPDQNYLELRKRRKKKGRLF